MSLQDRNILIVEDQLVTTLDLEQAVLDAGGRVIGPAADVSDALRLLNVERVDEARLRAEIDRRGAEFLVVGETAHRGEETLDLLIAVESRQAASGCLGRDITAASDAIRTSEDAGLVWTGASGQRWRNAGGTSMPV